MSDIRGANKIVKQLARKYEQLGWHVRWTNGGHIRWDGPNGEIVITSATPSDHRFVHRVETDMRRQARLVQERKRTHDHHQTTR